MYVSKVLQLVQLQLGLLRCREEFKLEVKSKCESAVQLFLNGCVRLTTWGKKAEEAIADLLSFKREVIQKKVGVNPADVPMVTILNWCSLCQIPVEIQDFQNSAVTWSLHENTNNCAAVLLPVYTLKKGRLHLEEIKALNALSQGGHNMDFTCSIVFKDQSDPRDMRPMLYPMRLLYPAACTDLSKNPFFSCGLRVERRTKEVAQLSGKKMRWVKDCTGLKQCFRAALFKWRCCVTSFVW